MRFTAFLDKKTNQARKELEILRDVLKEGGVEVKEFLKKQDIVQSTGEGARSQGSFVPQDKGHQLQIDLMYFSKSSRSVELIDVDKMSTT
jgi:hypothetical protein